MIGRIHIRGSTTTMKRVALPEPCNPFHFIYPRTALQGGINRP